MTEEIIIDDTFCPFDEDIAREIFKKMDNRIQRLKQENKELKKEKEKYKPFYELGAKCTQLNEVADSLNNLNSKYKSTLEEIKEIVIKATDISYSIEVNSMLYDIKDKINEVLYG